jgi:hypothetical protein
VDSKDTGRVAVNWIYLAVDSNYWMAVMNSATNLEGFLKDGNLSSPFKKTYTMYKFILCISLCSYGSFPCA